MSGRLALLLLTTMGVTACTEPEIDRPGTWKPSALNDQNLRAMLVNPQDAYGGTGALTARGDTGARAVTRLLTDKRRPLLDASTSRLGGGATTPADAALGATSGGGGGGGTTP